MAGTILTRLREELMRRQIGLALVILGGLGFLASAGAHAFLGWPAFAAALGELQAPADLADGLAVGWTFGSSAMATYGVLVLLAWNALRRDRAGAAAAIATIGASYLLFGAGALLYRFPNPHFVMFMVHGALLLAGAWMARPLAGRS